MAVRAKLLKQIGIFAAGLVDFALLKKVAAFTGNETNRWHLEYVYIKGNQARAMNGHIACAITVTDEHEGEFFLHNHALKKPLYFLTETGLKVDHGPSRKDVDLYPDFEKVIAFLSDEKIPKVSVLVNPKYHAQAMRLAAAAGWESVCIEICTDPKNAQPIIYRPETDSEGERDRSGDFIAVMPMRD